MDETLSSDHVIAELVDMGFDFSNITEAIENVGPSLEDAIEFILNGPRRNSNTVASSSKSSANNGKPVVNRLRQSTLRDPKKSMNKNKRKKTDPDFEPSISGPNLVPTSEKSSKMQDRGMDSYVETVSEALVQPCISQEQDDIGPDWELKAIALLQKHFGFSSLKSFQKEALTAWSTHQDCLVLAATGSGKSLCFQIPALLTGKVVVVISPLISLMHDQCMKLSKHGVSACFLGSGQTDPRIEGEAMSGTYNIIYVCPETLIRLIEPLQNLARIRGIALFAIDEVHCVSKWGHDFRPDYRRLSILRKNFSSKMLPFLNFDIPIMALTATATMSVREDILNSLCLAKETKIVLTSFFRPNLVFSVKHSATKQKPYGEDFQDLINIYTRNNLSDNQKHDGSYRSRVFSKSGMFEAGGISLDELSVEYLEDESDVLVGVDDFDVSCGEFFGESSSGNSEVGWLSENSSKKSEGISQLGQDLTEGLTIIYTPTRKETVSISKFLCEAGVKAAPYHAKLPKSHLRRVHQDFHENALQVVVATIAFGMGIDKLNVRRIIHYGWPQSLEAYYQEAGRAGRDGKLADCILYANLLKTPSLLPNKRNEEQTRRAYKMLSDCFRYGMNCSSCRAKVLVEYFGEQFSHEKCQMCDVCKNGPPELLNLKAEAVALFDALSSYHRETSLASSSPYDHATAMFHHQTKFKPDIDILSSKIMRNFPNFFTGGLSWWRGLARILEEKGFIEEDGDKVYVQIKYPKLTKCGHKYLQQKGNTTFEVYPEADMLLSMVKNDKPYSTFSEWGKGWANPVIRRQRLNEIRGRRNFYVGGSRSRLAVKLSKRKR